jgi:hypothetical protein
MNTTCILHYAFRAREPKKLARFYAELFDGQYLLHPVMTGLGIMIVKLGESKACFNGLLEFWPWDVEWRGATATFLKVDARPSPVSYGHLALKLRMTQDEIVAELTKRGIPYRIEPRAPGFSIPTIDDPEGNMIELFPNVDDMPLPPEALCPPDRADAAIAMLQRQFRERHRSLPPGGYPLLPQG